MSTHDYTNEIIKIDKALYSLMLSIRLHGAFRKNLLDLKPFKMGYKLDEPNGATMKEEPNLDLNELLIDSQNLQVISLGASSITLDNALNILGEKKPDSKETIDCVRCIIFQIRNAYAHNPLDPTWVVTRRTHRKTFVFEIDNLNYSIDLENINGQKLESKHFNGFNGYFKMVNYAKSYLERFIE